MWTEGSHLLGKEIHVHAFLQSQCGVGVPEAIGRARHALRAFGQLRFVQKIGNQGLVESFAGLPVMLVNTLSSGSVALEITRMRSK